MNFFLIKVKRSFNNSLNHYKENYMLKDRRHILLNNSNFSNYLPEPLKDSSLEMLNIGVSEDGYLDIYPGYKITSYSIDEVAKKITFNLEERHRANVLYCKACNSHKLHIHGYRTVSFKDAPINDFKVELQVQVPRYKCFCCGYTQSNKNHLFHPHYRITRRAYGFRDIEYYFLKLFQAFSIPKQSKLKLS